MVICLIVALKVKENNEDSEEEVTHDLKKLQIHDEISITDRNLEETQTKIGQESKVEEEDCKDQQFYDISDDFRNLRIPRNQ